MNIHIIDTIILSHQEAEYIIKGNGSFAFDVCASADYAVHALYNETNDEVLYLEDNIHGNPSDTLDGIEIGLNAAGINMTKDEMVVVLPEDKYEYNVSHVLSAIRDAIGKYDDTVN